MRFRTSLILILAAALLTGFSLYLAHRESQTLRQHTQRRRLMRTPLQKARQIEIYRGTTDSPAARFFPKETGLWFVELPAQDIVTVADKTTIEDLAALLQMAAQRPDAVATPEAAGLGRDATMLVVYGENENQETLLVGNMTEDGSDCYVARGETPDKVHRLHADLARVLRKNPEQYRSRDLFDMINAVPEAIVLEPGGKNPAVAQIRLERQQGLWRVTDPVYWPVAPETLQNLLERIALLRSERIVESPEADPGAYGLGEHASRVRVRVDGQEQVVRLGHETEDGSGVYALREGRPAITVVSKSLARLVHRGRSEADWVERFRRKELHLLDGIDVAVIDLHMPEGILTLSRMESGEETTWALSGMRNYPAEKLAVEQFLQVLGSLKATGFPTEGAADLSPYGLQEPILRIALKDTEQRQLLGVRVGTVDDGERFFVQVDGQPQVLEVDSRLALFLLSAPVAYRSRELARFEWNNVYEIVVQSVHVKRVFRPTKRNHFLRIEPDPGVIQQDAPQMLKALLQLSRLDCLSYLAEDVEELAEFGLDQPNFRVIVTLRSAADPDAPGAVALDLAVGAPVQNLQGVPKEIRPVYARLADERTVFIVDATRVATWLRDFK